MSIVDHLRKTLEWINLQLPIKTREKARLNNIITENLKKVKVDE